MAPTVITLSDQGRLAAKVCFPVRNMAMSVDTLHTLVSGMSISAPTQKAKKRIVNVSSKFVENLALFYKELAEIQDAKEFHEHVKRRVYDDGVRINFKTNEVTTKLLIEDTTSNTLESDAPDAPDAPDEDGGLSAADLVLLHEDLSAEDAAEIYSTHVAQKARLGPIEQFRRLLRKQVLGTQQVDELKSGWVEMDDITKNEKFDELVEDLDDKMGNIARELGLKVGLKEEIIQAVTNIMLEGPFPVSTLMPLRTRASVPFFLSPFGLR